MGEQGRRDGGEEGEGFSASEKRAGGGWCGEGCAGPCPAPPCGWVSQPAAGLEETAAAFPTGRPGFLSQLGPLPARGPWVGDLTITEGG